MARYSNEVCVYQDSIGLSRNGSNGTPSVSEAYPHRGAHSVALGCARSFGALPAMKDQVRNKLSFYLWRMGDTTGP